MNKMVSEIVNEKLLAVELLNKTVPAFKEGWCNYQEHKFPVNEFTIVKITKNMGPSFNLTYFNEKIQTTIVVPPDFVFKLAPEAKAKKIQKKFIDWMIQNIGTQLNYGGCIGSDPEIFVEDKKERLIPAFKFLGSKEKPSLAQSRNESNSGYINGGKNKVYWDGFQAEFETYPSHCMGWHADSIQCGLAGVLKHAKAYDKDAKLSMKTVFDITPKMIAESKPEHVAFGCNPSLNAYGMAGLKAPGNEVLYRSAGGHIHFGFAASAGAAFEKKSPETIVNIVKALDAVLGVACVSMFAKFDDPRRRQMYGLAGEYRTPPHGLEYRTLSNAWLSHPIIANIVFDLARGAFVFGERGYLKYWDCTEKETIRIINECDVDAARKVMETNNNLVVQILSSKLNIKENAEWAFKIITKGMETILKDPYDLETNWNLSGKWITHCDGAGKNVSKAIYTGLKKF